MFIDFKAEVAKMALTMSICLLLVAVAAFTIFETYDMICDRTCEDKVEQVFLFDTEAYCDRVHRTYTGKVWRYSTYITVGDDQLRLGGHYWYSIFQNHQGEFFHCDAIYKKCPTHGFRDINIDEVYFENED